MCDQDHAETTKDFEARGWVTRRQFGALLGAGVAMALPQVANAVTVTDGDVMIKTPDGTCDAYFVKPATGTGAGVLIWPDIFGLRPAFRTMGKRLAENGYAVLVVNPFYRAQKAPTAPQGAATPIPSLLPLAKPIQNSTTQATDAKAFIAWLDQQPSVAKNRKIGTQGYCMGGPMAFRTAANSDRIGAVASFHGGGLVTNDADSPLAMASKTKASFLVAIAANDDMARPMEKDVLKDTFAKAGLAAEVEVYANAAHGWCPPDSGVYNEPQAEKAWARLIALYGKALA
jgi:carboxymethylenebutenolidase